MPDSNEPKINTSASSAEPEHILTSIDQPATTCPAWCDLRTDPRHEFEHTSPTSLLRTHSLTLGQVMHEVERFGECRVHVVDVDVDSDELLEVHSRGAGRQLTPAFAALHVEVVRQGSVEAVLSSGQCREVAALLLAAADRLDLIQWSEMSDAERIESLR